MPNGLAVFSVAFGSSLSHMVLECQTVPECGPPLKRLDREGTLELQGLLKLFVVWLLAHHCSLSHPPLRRAELIVVYLPLLRAPQACMHIHSYVSVTGPTKWLKGVCNTLRLWSWKGLGAKSHVPFCFSSFELHSGDCSGWWTDIALWKVYSRLCEEKNITGTYRWSQSKQPQVLSDWVRRECLILKREEAVSDDEVSPGRLPRGQGWVWVWPMSLFVGLLGTSQKHTFLLAWGL